MMSYTLHTRLLATKPYTTSTTAIIHLTDHAPFLSRPKPLPSHQSASYNPSIQSSSEHRPDS